MLASNQVLNRGRYRIIHQFGQVESGSLYEAYDTVNDTNVVLRESAGQIGNATPGQLETLKFTFADQAKRWAEIRHESLLAVRDYFSDTDRQYLVMESVDGSDLRSLVEKENNKPAVADILRWADQILNAVIHLHTQKPLIIHQNIRPENVRLTSSYSVKLLMASGAGAAEIADIVEEGVGLNYLALEQLWAGLDSASQNVIANGFDDHVESSLRRPADSRTDVYGIGATLYFLLTGTAPADSLARTIDILDGKADPLADPAGVNDEVPRDLADIVIKALQIKREDRYSSAAAMREALNTVRPVPRKEARVQTPAPQAPANSNPQDDLEKERQLVEQRRLELEREQKHLEEERKRIELERRELEAKEKLRTGAAAPASNGAGAPAPEPSKPSSRVRTAATSEEIEQEIDDLLDNLLDLPQPAIKPLAPQASQSDVLSLDSVPSDPIHVSTGEFSNMFAAPPRSAGIMGRPAVIFAAVAAVLIIGIGVWMSSGSSTPPPEVTVQPPVTTSIAEPQTESVSQPVDQPAVTEPTTAPASAYVSPETVTPAETTHPETPAKQKAKKTAAEAKPTTEKKKTVTVDDLINDN